MCCGGGNCLECYYAPNNVCCAGNQYSNRHHPRKKPAQKFSCAECNCCILSVLFVALMIGAFIEYNNWQKYSDATEDYCDYNASLSTATSFCY